MTAARFKCEMYFLIRFLIIYIYFSVLHVFTNFLYIFYSVFWRNKPSKSSYPSYSFLGIVPHVNLVFQTCCNTPRFKHSKALYFQVLNIQNT